MSTNILDPALHSLSTGNPVRVIPLRQQRPLVRPVPSYVPSYAANGTGKGSEKRLCPGDNMGYDRPHMRAVLTLRERVIDEDGDLTELVLWQVPRSPKHPAGIRYRLAFLLAGTTRPAILYDNHHPKGHHRHRRGVEEPYGFSTADRLLTDFQADVRRAKAARKERTE